MNRHFRILLLVILLVNTYIVNAQSLIKNSNCIIGYKASVGDILTVKTISTKCQTTCSSYCLEKFKLSIDGTSNNDMNYMSADQGLINLRNGVLSNNKDRLQACLSSCYAGKKFDTKIRVPISIDVNTGQSIDDTGDLPYPWRCDIMSNATTLKDLSCNFTTNILIEDTSSLCSLNELDAAFYSSGNTFKGGDQVSISLSNISPSNTSSGLVDQIINAQPNTIYLCGFKTVFFSPEYFVDSISYTGQDPTSTIFSPHNNSQIKTGIKVKNGDYLNISYIGRYNSNSKKQNDDDYKLDIFIGDTKVNFDVSPYQLNDYEDKAKNDQAKQCNDVCSVNNTDSMCNSLSCGVYTTNNTVSYGLNTNTFWQGSPSLFNKVNSNTLYKQFRNTILNGTIENISDTAQELIIQYPNVKPSSQGGYFVSIEWQGCKYTDGERLQYTVVNSALNNSINFNRYMVSPDGPIWKDLTILKNPDNTTYSIVTIDSSQIDVPAGFNNDSAVKNGLPAKIEEYTGQLYFKIKTLDASEASDLDDSERSRANTNGGYNIKVVNLTEDTNFIINWITDFMTMLKGIPERIFDGFTNSLEYLIIIRLLLIFYIAFTGFSFMIGLAQISQQEAVIRIFKIAVLLMLFTENSFEFFNQYLFNAFSFTSINFFANTFTPEINIELAPGLDSGSSNCFAPGVPIKMLCVLTKDLQFFFRWDFWNRIIGMAFSGFFLCAIGIIIGITLYIVVIIKIIFLYCIALLATTVTISLGPIFLPLILFKYTKSFFDSWIKQLIALLLQPVFIFLSISLFRVLFITLIQSLMGNAACKVCWFEIFSWCWIELYMPLSLSSSPSFVSMPMSGIGMLLGLYFVGYGMYSFSTQAANMSQRLIAFSLMNIAEGSVARDGIYQPAKTFANIATAPLDVLAIDDASRDQRKNNRQNRSQQRDKK